MQARDHTSLVLLATLAMPLSCSSPRPEVQTAAPPKPLTVDEIQTSVTGTARLHRHCRDREGPTGLYVIRLLIDPRGRVSEARPRRAPSRAEDAALYSGVPRYIEVAPEPDNAVTRCLANALAKLQLRPFSGPAVGFDYPVVVERLPPSEPATAERKCAEDSECVFAAKPRCVCPPCRCPVCREAPENWRRSINRAAFDAQREQRATQKRRCRKRRRSARARKPSCQPCPAVPLLGARALCIDGQCTVR